MKGCDLTRAIRNKMKLVARVQSEHAGSKQLVATTHESRVDVGLCLKEHLDDRGVAESSCYGQQHRPPLFQEFNQSRRRRKHAGS
jgi:hypothetical protein